MSSTSTSRLSSPFTSPAYATAVRSSAETESRITATISVSCRSIACSDWSERAFMAALTSSPIRCTAESSEPEKSRSWPFSEWMALSTPEMPPTVDRSAVTA